VDHFSRRFQLQEKLTLEIANAIQDITKAKFVEVSMKAKHLCMVTRGVEKVNSYMETFYSTAP
jgi:GTP cyclohydrolase I